jgi:AcrR family transcriptional regulator
MRSDARRNRERVLAAAIEAFAAEGLAVSVHEIARRAGVGTGTVSRHFPTKQGLYEAIVLERVSQLVSHARQLSESLDPGEAFFEFFGYMVREGGTNHGLADALAGAGFDAEAAASGSSDDVIEALRRLLTAAQRAKAVRRDVDVADVKALIVGCLARPAGSAKDRDRLIAVVTAGLRPEPR